MIASDFVLSSDSFHGSYEMMTPPETFIVCTL